MTVKGKVVVVTGAFGALGSAVAEASVREGAVVAALDYAKPVPGLAERLGPDALLLGGADLTSPASAEGAMAAVAARFGRIDALFNVAGGFAWGTIAGDPDDALWERMYAINLKTALNASRAALPSLIASGDGRIVNVGAQAANRAAGGHGPLRGEQGRRCIG